MAITYTWKVTGVKTKNQVNEEGETLQDAVVQTYWQKTGTDENGNDGSFSGATPFTAANVSQGSFVPFASLTEEIVLGWIQSVVSGDYEEHVNGKIAKQIDEKVNEVSESSLPWATEPVLETPPE